MRQFLICMGISLLLAIPAFAEDTTKVDTIEKPKAEQMKKDTAEANATDTTTKKEPEWITTESGLKYREVVVGEGTEAKIGMQANCHYTLWLVDEKGVKGKLVQSSKGGDPFQCQIGFRLIQGWSEGMVGMKEGGTRELIIPPHIGYGSKAMGTMIPANSTLFFEIEFIGEAKQ